MDEKELIKKALKDKEAFAEIVNLYYKEVFRYIYKRTFDKEISKDLTQETFLRALKCISSYKEKCPFVFWLLRIASNVINSHYREEINDNVLLSNYRSVSPEFDNLEEFDYKYIQECILKLRPIDQTVITLVFFEHKSIKEAALIIGHSFNSTRTIYYRALKNLKKKIFEEKNGKKVKHFFKNSGLIYGGNMRRRNNKDTEKIEGLLRNIKIPELSDEEIEPYKREFQGVLQSKFSEITAQRDRRRVLRVKLAYGLAIFALVFTLFSFMYVKPYLIRVATARIINDQLKFKVTLKDVVVKDGVGIVIYNYQELVVNVPNKTVEIFQPVPYEPSEKERDKAIEIVRNSKEAKYFVAKEGGAPQDISKNDVVSVEGLMFPNSGKKLVEVRLVYTPTSYHPGSPLPLMTAKFTVDVEKGKIQP